MSILKAFVLEARAEVMKSFRAPEFAIPTIIFPLVFYSVFGVMLGNGGQQATYLLATFGVFSVMGPSMFGFGVGVAMERERGWLDLKRVAPMPVWTYLAAKMIAALVFASVTLVLLYSIAKWLGGVELPARTWALLFFAHLAMALPFSLLGLTLGFLVKGNGAVAITNIVFFALSISGGLWMPMMIFPEWFQNIGSYLPSFHAGQLALGTIGLGSEDWLDHLSALAVFTAICGAAAMFSWNTQKR